MKMKRSLPCCGVALVLSLLLFTQSFAQNRVSGTVSSAKDKSPLPGVSVIVKNTQRGTITDSEGKYSIAVSSGETLVFSFVGFALREIAISNQSVLDVALEEDVTQLGEIVVTALGIKKEAKKLGYATASVTPDQININRTVNFMNALQGKMAGVNITTLGSGPAGTSKVRIRGQSSFGGTNAPLIVINGVPIDNTNFALAQGNQGSDGSIQSRGNNNSDGGDGLSSINPDDIESMTVLKGATAAALYGSRAKDGVIMITTKTKGAGRGIGVEFNSNFTTDIPMILTDWQYEYGQGEGGVRPTTANPTSGVWSFGEKFQPGMTQVLFNGVTVPYVPQRNQIREFLRNGNTFTNTISLSSGTERGGFNLSISNMDNTGIMPNNSFNRKTFNLGFTQTLGEKLIVSGNANYSKEINRNPPQFAQQDFSVPTVLYTIANSMPMDVLRDNAFNAQGNEYLWSRFTNRTNPYFNMARKFENIFRDRLFGNITLRYNIKDWLYAQVRVGQDFWTRQQEYNFPTGAASLAPAPAGFVNGSFIQEVRRLREVNTDFLIGATRKFGDFGVDATFGGNQLYVQSELNSVQGTDFVVRDLYTIMNTRVRDPIYGFSERKVNSLYGAAEFSYKNFLFLNVTARNDWFSTLSPENRSILYPSITSSFVFSDAFNNMPSWLNFGKIRAAYAEVGSDTDVGAYANNLFYGINANLFPIGTTSGQAPLGFISGLTVPNANLRPMRVSEAEVGLELKMFNNRVSVDFAFYNKITKDQIVSAQISDASGFTTTRINSGQSRNRGFEYLINVVPFQSDNFRWEVSFNGSYNTTLVQRILTNDDGAANDLNGDGRAEQIAVGESIWRAGQGQIRQVVGQPIGMLFANAYARDAQGRKIFDNAGFPVIVPLQPFGSTIPKWVGGITNSFNYKGIMLSFLIDYKLGHIMSSGTNFNAWRHGLHKGTLVGREQNRVIGEGVNQRGEVNTVAAPLQAYYEQVRSRDIGEQFIYDAGFWKLRQITAGYDFTKHLPSSWFIKGLRLNFVANNVLILKKWVDNIDPEQMGYGSDNLNGLEATGVPTTRSFGFNLNVKF
ncbi:MAG: SusC/RagA family TonB-linked outer membrane protein [Thermoflexibacter sp.]